MKATILLPLLPQLPLFPQLLLSLALPCALLCAPAHAAQLPDYASVRRDFVSSEASLQDRHGALLQQMRLNPKERRLSWITLDQVSPALRIALIASEDKQFYQHAGVDWNAVAGSAWDNLWRKKTRGASTISMQLVGLLDQDLQRKSGSRSLTQKWSQAWLAGRLEHDWKKDQILEAYLNLVSFRGEVVGVHALSRVLFEKHPSGLNGIEAALAVALIRAPNAPQGKVVERACGILKQQQRARDCSALAGLAQLALGRTGRGAGAGKKLLSTAGEEATTQSMAAPQLAPHLARKLLTKPNQTLRSTLDIGVQRFAFDALRRHLLALVNRNVEDGAVVVLDNASGDVLAWVGSSGTLSAAAEVDGVMALRQPGSTLKPFLYQQALEQRWLTAASLLNDARLNLPTDSGQYIPQNYDHQYKGLISVRTALASSLNIPAVSTLQMVTPVRFAERLTQLGLPLKYKGDYYGYSLALGSADVNLLSLTNAYRTLANGGMASAPRLAMDQPRGNSVAVLDPAASFVIGDILSDRAARAPTFGLDSVLATRVWAAVKTGTSKDMRDNWCIGYTRHYTIGVWVGNASGLPMWNVSGVTGAAPVWHDMVHYLESGRSVGQGAGQSGSKAAGLSNDQRSSKEAVSGWSTAQSAPPPGVEVAQITFQDQLEAPRKEYFLAGTSQQTIIAAHPERNFAALRYPTPGMLIALDPDIPPARQRVRLLAQGLRAGRLVLDGKTVASQVNQRQELSRDWMPWPGKHQLQLFDAAGKQVDRLNFEVRGAVAGPGKAAPRRKS
jgi:penicillin-binding protein 1C